MTGPKGALTPEWNSSIVSVFQVAKLCLHTNAEWA